MATRRSEWLASIKPILDRDEAKKDAAALAKELGDILEVKVDASPENLDELAKEFNAQLKTMGKQPIVFSEKTLRGIVSQFTKAIAEGISKGVANVDFGAQLEELNKKREKILKAQNRANQAMKARTRMERLEGFNINTAELMPIDGDVAKEAQELVDILYDSAKKIDQAAEKYGKSSSHYTSAVIEAQEAYNKYLRMQKTLGTMPPSKLSTIPKDVRALYDKLGPDREKYEVGGGVNIPFEETFEAEKILDSFEELSDAFEGLVDNAGKFDKMLKQIDAKIEEITRKARESGGVDDGILRGAKDGLKTLNEIEAAYKRLKVDKGTKLRQQNESHIKSALDFDPSKNSVGIKTFAKDYYNAAASGDWAEEYHALLRYVKLYESYLTSTNKTHQNKVTAKNNPFTPLYEQLKPMAENARNMLQNILNMGEGKPLVGMGSAEGGMGAGSTNEDVANAQKIREEAEAKVRAEREALELARQRREEEEKAAKAAEQKRKAGEAAIEINKRVTEEAEKEKLAKDAILNSLRQIVDFSAKQSMEYMSLIGSDAATDVVGGADYTVDTDTLIEQLIDNLKNNILVSLHNHPDDMLAFTPSDITSYGGLYKTQGIDIHGIIANGVIQTVDFAGISKEVILQIAQSFSNHLSEAAQNSDGLFNYTDGKLTVSDDVQALADKSPGAYNQIQEELRLIINNALSRAFTDNKLQPTIKTFDGEHLPQLAEYLLQAGQNARDAIEPVEKLNQLMVIRESMSAGKVQDEAVKHQQNTAAIKEEVDAEKRLNEAKGQIVDADDDFENIAKENGALADKLELLRDIAEQYGNNISQKQRDRYEDLNQKDMNEGLTPKEDERYWELGEQIDEADQALEEFGNTYDRIIVKLENGKKIEILPDDKGLRTLAKIDEEYGESYNGVTIEDVYFERVKQEALATEQAVDGLNESLEKTQQLTSGDGVGSSTGDASSADVEAAQAEAEKQRLEKERLEAEKLALQNELYMSEERVKSAQDSEAQAYERVNDLTSELQEQRDEIYHLEQRLAEAHEVDNDALWTAEQRANEAEERANQLERKLAESFDGDKKQGSVNTEELKTLLNSIVYNVKIAHDDNDKTANKIALDDSTLETTLSKVFANILNPQTQQNDSEQKQSSWALESTLQTVKGVLDNIHTNTAKIGTVGSSNVDTIAGTALDSRLTEIKSVLESINQKIVDGGKIFNRDGAKQAYKDSQQDTGSKQANQSNMFKSLQKDYENMGKLSAQFSATNNLETKAMLENLKQTIARKREELKLTIEQNTALRKKYSIAFDAEKRLLDAAKAQEEIDKQANQDNRDEKAAWKKKVKDAQRATGINAATSAANAGDQTVLRAIGTDGVSKDIENKAKELSNQIKTLRMLRDEIDKKGDRASAEDRDNLSKQISKVKELKTEVDGYLKIHEKYSGDNVTDLGDASSFGVVGTDQYWNNITEAIKKAQSGKMTIKGLNADTGELTGTTKIAANTFATWSATVDPLTGRLSMLRTGIKKTETIFEQITRKTREIFTYFSGSSIIFKAFNELKKGIQYVREIDLALTELKKVTDETEETYDKFLDTASKTADKVGSTIQKVVSSTADWARLGYSMKEAAEFAESTQILMNVSEFTDVSQATDTLISAVQAFGYTAETSMDVVDLLNTIGKQNCRNYIVIYS